VIIAWRTFTLERKHCDERTGAGAGVLVYGGLWLASPRFTIASLQSQGSKGSWKLPGRWLDGN